jgi:3-hydroxyisobutyrate dehydrogenase-like beta-hydroxyacid dehydrogenase
MGQTGVAKRASSLRITVAVAGLPRVACCTTTRKVQHTMNIAIVGLGEVGRAYATALEHAGHSLFLCDAKPSPQAEELARSWDVPVHRSMGGWMGACDWILSCVTGTVALSVVAQCLPYAAASATLCDLTTATPDTKRAASTAAHQQGLQYLDVAIMGAVALGLHKTPLLVAGDGAMAFQALVVHAGGKVSVIDGGVAGDAIALKILRSIFTKGLEALSVELLMTAERQGVREKLYAQLQDIDDTPLRTFIDMLVRTHVVHAKRRAHEVSDAAAEMASQHLHSRVLPGVASRFEKTIAALDQDPVTPVEPTTEQALQWLLRHEG